MKTFVLTFGGCIASGKSTISHSIAELLGWPSVSFGDYIRHTAKLRELDDSRETLQNIGQSLIEEGWNKFCWSVLQQTNWSPGDPLIIDGIRHIEALNTLRSIASPFKVYLVFLEVKETTQKLRLINRQAYIINKSSTFEDHSTEIQVKTILPQVADLIVYNDKPVEETIYEIFTWIEKLI